MSDPSPAEVTFPPDEPVAQAREVWRRLGLPGLFDAHVHFLEPSLQEKVFAQFDQAGPKIGREWPIRYRDSHEVRVSQLRALGVRRFPSLPYAHRPGVAGSMNRWAAEFSERVPECLRSATFYPEPGVDSVVSAALNHGVEVFKIHVQVGEFHLDDPLLDKTWGLLAEAGTPIVVHASSGPVGNTFTGPEPLARVLRAHPELTVVVAHMGSPEEREFLELAERYRRTFLDTTMIFTDFWDLQGGYPSALLPRVRDLGEKVLFGSDFPTIPYPYFHQLESLERLGFGDDWLRGVLWHNAAGLFAKTS